MSIQSVGNNNIWVMEDQKALQFESTLRIPNAILSGVSMVDMVSDTDLDSIPNTGGCYWIWTTEPVLHSCISILLQGNLIMGR